MSGVRDRFVALETALKAQFIERDAPIDGLLAALVSGQHVLLLGPPGTAKSALTRALTGSIEGAAYFEWLLTKASPPEEILGPISIQGLEQDSYRRVTQGKLPNAHIAFLDEIWKCNSTVLNAMLSILNERRFHNDGQPQTCPLLSCVGASNEYPDGTELGALYDRFLVRYWVDAISEQEGFVHMLSGIEPKGLPGALTLGDIETAQAEVRSLSVSQDTVRMLAEVRAACLGAGIVASDRRWRQALRYLRGVAWLEGQAEVDEDTFLALADCLWREHKERPAVLATVGKVTNPAVVQATEILDAAKELLRESARKPNEAGFAWTTRVGRAYQDLEKMSRHLAELAEQNPRKARIAAAHGEVKSAAKALKEAALKSVGMA